MNWDTSVYGSPPLLPRQIEGFEKITGFNLPDCYRKIVQEFPNAYPSRSNVKIKVGNELFVVGFGVLMTLDPLSEFENVLGALIRLRKHHDFPESILPFAVGGGGDYLCFSYKSPNTEPEVVFWFHEISGSEGIYPVAENFAALIDMLFNEHD